MRAGQGEDDDQGDEDQDREDEDAAFGAGGSSAEDGLACGVAVEETLLDHESAVGGAVEEVLRPIPRGVEADSPPQRTGAPQAEAKDEADQSGGKQSHGRFADVALVAETEQEREDEGRGPESQGCAVAGLERPLVEAGEAAGECVLGVAAGDVLLEQANQKKTEQPDCAVADNVAAKEQAAVDDKESALPKRQNEERQARDSPSQAGEEVLQLAAVAETVDGVGTALDLRHDPGNEKDQEKLSGFADQHEGWLTHCLRAGLRRPGSMRKKFVRGAV